MYIMTVYMHTCTRTIHAQGLVEIWLHLLFYRLSQLKKKMSWRHCADICVSYDITDHNDNYDVITQRASHVPPRQECHSLDLCWCPSGCLWRQPAKHTHIYTHTIITDNPRLTVASSHKYIKHQPCLTQLHTSMLNYVLLHTKGTAGTKHGCINI